jgi:phage portal protein BeeE
MGLLSFFKARAAPKNSVGGGFSFLFGGTSAGKNVNESTAMRTTAVYACVRILSETIAGLPLHVYQYNGDGKARVPAHPL